VTRRAVGMSRAALGLYAGVMTAGTHWPRLQLGDPEHPVDKVLHFVAFGGLAFFLSRCRFVRSTLALFLLVALWVVVDEATQALPGLGRSFSLEDMLAGWMGVATTCMLLWSTRPLRTPIAALRRRRFDGVVDLVLSDPMRFMGLIATVAAGVTITMPAAVVMNGMLATPTPVQAAITGMVLGGLGGAFTYVILGVRAFEERVMACRICLSCGGSVRESETTCSACGAEPLPAQWYPVPGVRASAIVKGCTAPVLGGLATILLAVIALQLSAGMVGGTPFALWMNEWLRGPARGMESNFHTLFLAAVAAVTVDRCRRRIAIRLEQGSEQCLACGHDLRGTAASNGLGRCGECGAGFLRGLMPTADSGNP
jgi:hypothetical protein